MAWRFPNPCSGSSPTVPVEYWSNPDVNYWEFGTPMGTDSLHNNAKVLNLTSYILSNYRGENTLVHDYNIDTKADFAASQSITSENFLIKAGSDVTFTAGDEIVLGPGFQVEAGGEFYAEVDPDVGNIAAKQREGIAGRSDDLEEEAPNTYSLSQNYPNPFNPATVIPYELPAAGHVTLEVFDMLGRRVALLVDEAVSAGRHEVQFDASNLSSGLYIYRIRANNFVQTRQMTLIK